MRRLVLVALVSALLGGTAVAAVFGPAEDLAGRYGQSRVLGIVQPERVDDVIEIVPVAPDAAYVRLRLYFGNLHSCSLHGVATEESGALVYREPLPFFGERRCTLRIARRGNRLHLSDDDGSCRSHCGASGQLRDVSLPWASRRRITYLARLRASSEYREALEEWRTGRSIQR